MEQPFVRDCGGDVKEVIMTRGKRSRTAEFFMLLLRGRARYSASGASMCRRRVDLEHYEIETLLKKTLRNRHSLSDLWRSWRVGKVL